MNWVKEGLVLEPAGQAPWIGTHAALPVIAADGDAYRLYFSSRDKAGRSQIGFCELSLDGSRALRAVSPAPSLAPGPLGTFDDAGTTSSCLVRHEGRQFFFYTGWSLGVTVPFYLHAGLAIGSDGGQFQRHSSAPLLERNDVDPYLTASPWVLVDGVTWRMWYVSGTGWEIVDGKPRHRYLIKYAESGDGRRWDRTGHVCIDFQSADEYAISRPCVVRHEGGYRMWYSVRGHSYRLGYAESDDGIVWVRKDDEAGLAVSPSGWDSEMIAYPIVFHHRGRLHMLYNGNGYGRTGIGLARSA